MLTASTKIMQEDWVQRWLDKLTPKQQALVTEVLQDVNKYRKPTPTAVAQAEAAVTNSTQLASRLALQ
jgi:hypothetical protein